MKEELNEEKIENILLEFKKSVNMTPSEDKERRKTNMPSRFDDFVVTDPEPSKKRQIEYLNICRMSRFD